MSFNIDLIVFIFYIIVVFVIGILSAGKNKNTDDYYLAGRKLNWWVIGESLNSCQHLEAPYQRYVQAWICV